MESMDMNDIRFGGFWRRVVAMLIDVTILVFISLALLLIGAVALMIGFPSERSALLSGNLKGLAVQFFIAYYITIVAINAFYFTYFHGNTGQTPGKALLGLQVLQTDGARVTYGIAFLRWVGYIISKMFLWIGFLWVAFDRKKRGWHDYIAGTVVILLLKDIEPWPDHNGAPAHPLPVGKEIAPMESTEQAAAGNGQPRPSPAIEGGA